MDERADGIRRQRAKGDSGSLAAEIALEASYYGGAAAEGVAKLVGAAAEGIGEAAGTLGDAVSAMPEVLGKAASAAGEVAGEVLGGVADAV